MCSAQNTVVSPNFLVSKFFEKAQFFAEFRGVKLSENCVFPQNFHSRKLGEITVFYAVVTIWEHFNITIKPASFVFTVHISKELPLCYIEMFLFIFIMFERNLLQEKINFAKVVIYD